MTRTWVPDPGWTHTWELPSVLRRPISDRGRGTLVALSRAGLGPKRLAEVLRDVDRIEEAAGAFARRWRNALCELRALDVRAVTPSDDEYPDDLRAIVAPPLLLFVRGRPLSELGPAVAIVGARACTSGAARFASRLGEAFAAAGFTVVSGLARGIDGAAHRGAVDAGSSIAVLGTGIDVVYPSEHRELASRIAKTGAIVSEFPPGVGPRAWHFPARNRIIAGMCRALVVVEAGIGSGALITANFALDAGREVFACTTGPENPAGAGVRAMILEGAPVIVDPEQAVQAVIDLLGNQGVAFKPVPRHDRALDLAGELRSVYDAITEDCTVEEVAANSCLPLSRIASGLAELELEGVVTASNGRWRRT